MVPLPTSLTNIDIMKPNKKSAKTIDPLHFHDPQASKRLQIENQILLLQQQIQKLQIARNALLPISTLPNEVFSNIFSICRMKGYLDAPEMHNLLKVTWVCHHWRDIALSDASLWTYIGEENFSWAAPCLSRSKDVPLEVVFNKPCTSSVRALLFPQFHRFRIFEISFLDHRDSGAQDLFSDFLTQPAPVLESLTLHRVAISTPLFSGISPVLHTVDLSYTDITWTPTILPFAGLKHLSINCPQPQLSVVTFVQALPSSLPRLETLEVKFDKISSPISSNTHLPRQVYFPNLRKLLLQGFAASTISQCFELFNLPPSTNVDACLGSYYGDSDDLEETASDFLHLLQSAGALGHCSISAWIVHNGGPCNTFGLEASRNSDDQGLLSFNLIHPLRWEGIVEIFAGLPVRNLKSLSLLVPYVPGQEWTSLFGPLVNLEELALRDESTVDAFIEFIAGSTPEKASDTTVADSRPYQNFPFKALRRLKFFEHNIDPDRYTRDDGFCSALRVRRDYGHRLEKMWISEGIFDAESLRQVVDEVIVVPEDELDDY
ncbi:hypothetical protein BDN72DRAFT_897624 [Pluteus cervinus]|uniref:Uncharacterized protein n=1 Tax=Pluteus cervinus TaxID=181527 RepID=A0ACD3AT53_9AGAR|nr:hypothetical protein BDN72DRAFT_897624 [Pluteus cervinus]